MHSDRCCISRNDELSRVNTSTQLLIALQTIQRTETNTKNWCSCFLDANQKRIVKNVLTTMVEIGDKMRIPAGEKFHPETGHFGICVWISSDGETVALQCERSHHGKKNTVFLVKISTEK